MNKSNLHSESLPYVSRSYPTISGISDPISPDEGKYAPSNKLGAQVKLCPQNKRAPKAPWWEAPLDCGEKRPELLSGVENGTFADHVSPEKSGDLFISLCESRKK